MRPQLPVSAIAALVLLLFAGSSLSQHLHPNQIGLFLTPDGTGAAGTDVIGNPVDAFLVLTKPTDLSGGGSPFSHIAVFECQLNFSPAGGILLQNESLGGVGANQGDTFHISDGYLEYEVSGQGWPVTNESIVLVYFTFVNTMTGPVEVTMGPTSDPFIEGEMVFLGTTSYEAQVMHPSSGSHDAPVFIFNGEALPVKNETFGSVKALYR